MISVQEAVQEMTDIFKVPNARAKAIARRLIDDEVLPKSSGSRIAKITTNQFVKLIFACLCADKVNDATRVAEKYYNLPSADQSEEGDDGLNTEKSTAGQYFARVFDLHIDREIRRRTEAIDYAGWELLGSINICTNMFEIAFRYVTQAHEDAGVLDPLLTYGEKNISERQYDYYAPKSIISISSMSLGFCATRWVKLLDDYGATEESTSDAEPVAKTSPNEASSIWTFTGKVEPEISRAAMERLIDHIKAPDDAYVRTIGKHKRTYPTKPPRKL
ncbi:hypothetical protein J2847_002934 [Azospirillum agricola]|uniref:hypothetical protein n=1 Tax=Azospirillum agricola TaxID=1720247 RepID=UPI001AE7716E|nr:hypothetical protein [Azospirillum agricola]MBP2229635.1 hypothetical protein [Azospirillum agricola]